MLLNMHHKNPKLFFIPQSLTASNIRLLPCPFTGPKMFWASPNILSQPKHLTAFSASSKTFVSAQKPVLLNANHLFVWHKMIVTGRICKYFFGLAQKIWTSTNHFGTCKMTRNIKLQQFYKAKTC